MAPSPVLLAAAATVAGGVYLQLIPTRLITFGGILVAGGVGALVYFQENLLYIPVIQGFKTPQDNPEGYQSPDQHKMPFEELTIDTPDGLKLHGWFLPARNNSESCNTVLFCHENAGNIGLRLPEFFHVRSQMPVNQLVFDYRGYGFSEGAPSEEGLITDTIAALHVLQDKAHKGQIDGRKIVLCGRSLGGAVVVHVAAALSQQKLRFPPAAAIVENSFTSISAMVDAKFPFLNVPFFKEKFLRLRWNSLGHVGKITLPLLFLSSVRDEIVPAVQMRQLHRGATAAAVTEFHAFPDATHNDIWTAGGIKYWEAKRSFIERHGTLPVDM